MKVFINFANGEEYYKQQNFALRAAKIFGNFDKTIGYKMKDIDEEFKNKHANVFAIKRGAGLWLWKPYIILKTLNQLKDGDYVFYLDSGFFITKKVDLLINALEKTKQEVMAFQTYYPEEHWAKKSLFENMNCVGDEYRKTNQFIAGICLVKNSQKSRAFFQELIGQMKLENLNDAKENEPQYPLFIEHRHDQSVYSLFCKKNNLIPFRAPFVFGQLGAAYAVMKKTEIAYKKEINFNFKEFENSSYPTMLQVNRSFKFLGINMNLFFVPYIYLKLLNSLPFKSKVYNFLLKLGIKGL